MATALRILSLLVYVGFLLVDSGSSCQEPSLVNVTDLSEEPQALSSIPLRYLTSTVTPLEHSRCPSTMWRLLQRHSYFTSCPTYDVQDYDPNRIPTIIVQKRCRCRGCINSAGSCNPINAVQRVLRRVGCSNGVNQYATVLEPVVVGCECRKLCGHHIPLESCPLFSEGSRMRNK